MSNDINNFTNFVKRTTRTNSIIDNTIMSPVGTGPVSLLHNPPAQMTSNFYYQNQLYRQQHGNEFKMGFDTWGNNSVVGK